MMAVAGTQRSSSAAPKSLSAFQTEGLSESVRRRADPIIKPDRGKGAERDESHVEEWGRQVVRKRGCMTEARLDWLYCASALPGLLRVYQASPWWGQDWVAAAQAKARRAGTEGAGRTEEGSRCRLCSPGAS